MPSACWRGIFEARDLLVNGTRWQIGDGCSVRAWEDPWLPRPRDFWPLSQRSSSNMLVSDFISVDRMWNVDLVGEHFEQADVDLILTIPLSRRASPDKLVWHYDLKGCFSTRSAYDLARQLCHAQPSSSTDSVSVPLWKSVWFSQVPSKIKVHIWKVVSDILPTVVSLRSKHVFINQGCFFCNEEEEVVVGGYYGRVANVTSPDLVEAYAGRLACEMDRKLQLFPIVLESDCLNLVKAIQSDMEDSAFGMIVEDIKQDLLSLNSFFFSHVFRESNLVAHKLARLALSCSSPSRWVGTPPGELQGLLASPPCNR
ncbi:hypothetical protein ACLB2K_043755 [Fragaria x ananassa]